MIGAMAALTFLVLDLFAPNVAAGTRQGSGFGIGYGMVGGQPECPVSAEQNAAQNHEYNLAEAGLQRGNAQ